MQSQRPKSSKKKRGLFSNLFGKKKEKIERLVEQEHLREVAGLSVCVEVVEPFPSDRTEPSPRAKKSKDKPGLFSKLFGKKNKKRKNKRKEYQEQSEEITMSGRAGGAPTHGSPALVRDLNDTDLEAHSSVPRRHTTSSFTDIGLVF